MIDKIKIALIVSSTKVIYSDMASFRIGLKITNSSVKTEKFDISKTKLFVNEVESIAWNLCTQNGTIINLTIPAGKSKTVQWPIGIALFKTPGVYNLKLKWNSFVQEIKVTVTK
jgi:hypothetical protein